MGSYSSLAQLPAFAKASAGKVSILYVQD